MATGGARLTHGNVIYDAGDSFKKFINLKRLVPLMVDKKILKKKMGKLVITENDPELLLAYMKHKMSLDDFTVYLDILVDLGGEQPASSEGGTRYFMKVMKGSLEGMKPEPGSKLDQAIYRYVATISDPLSGHAKTKKHQATIQSSESEIEMEPAEEIVKETETSHGEQVLKDTETSHGEQVLGDTETSHGEELPTQPSQAAGELKTDQSMARVDTPIVASVQVVTTEEISSKHEEPLEQKVATTPAHIETDSSTRQDAMSSAPVPPPPPGQIGPTVSKFFTAAGGRLYSPISGVSVFIPPDAIPVDQERFFLSFHVYLGKPFQLPDGAVLCSTVVWFYQKPCFAFTNDVVVKIPHAVQIDLKNGVADDSSLCVFTWGKDKEGPIYKLSEKVSADFSDGYHAVLKLRHFSPYSPAMIELKSDTKDFKTFLNRTRPQSQRERERKKRIMHLNKVSSDSFEKSVEEGTVVLTPPSSRSGSWNSKPPAKPLLKQEAMDTEFSPTSFESEGSEIRYSVARLMPSDRSGDDFKVLFGASYDIPAVNSVLYQYGKKYFEKDFDEKSFKICSAKMTDEFFQFDPEDCTSSGWAVTADSNPVIPERSIHNVPKAMLVEDSQDHDAIFLYLPTVTFDFTYLEGSPKGKLSCKIKVMGAESYGDECLFFNIESTTKSTEETYLTTSSYLYGEDIRQALNNPGNDVTLDPEQPDHIKFLADIGHQIPNSRSLGETLGLKVNEMNNMESMYSCGGQKFNVSFIFLVTWASANSHKMKTIHTLKEKLKQIGLRFDPGEPKGGSNGLVSAHLDTIPLSEMSHEFMLDVSTKLQYCWMPAGSLMGIHPRVLYSIFNSLSHTPIDEQSHEMIYQWKRREGNRAMLGTLCKAIQCLFDDSSYLWLVNDVHGYLKTFPFPPRGRLSGVEVL